MKDINFTFSRFHISIIELYVVLVSFCYILPVLKYSISYIPLALLLLFVYALYIICNGYRVDYSLLLIFISSLGLFFMHIFFMTPMNFSESVNEVIRALRFVAPAYLFFLLSSRTNKKSIFRVFWVLTGLIIFICFKTISALNENNMLARILAMGSTIDAEMALFRFQNVAGFEFCYGIGFFTLFWFYVFLNRTKKILKIVGIIIYIGGFYFIVRTQYMTLLLLTVIFSLVLLYMKIDNKVWHIIIIFFIVILFFLLPEIITLLTSLPLSEQISLLIEKIFQIEDFVKGNELSVLGTRPELYGNAFDKFLDSPIWGNAVERNGVPIKGMDQNHSMFLGTLQGMGIIGAFFCYYPIFIVMHKVAKNSDMSDKNYSTWFSLFIMMLVLSILNPIQYCFEISFIYYLYIPCGIKLYMNDN